jgi:beta-ribofuranosylaminobenzene 5'-phosphate synthase
MGRHYSPSKLIELSGRGGASGIGVNTYFRGGLLGDLGHTRLENAEFVPSGSIHRPDHIPQLAFRITWPDKWKVQIIYPQYFEGLSGKMEREFMVNNTPLSRSECASVAYALLFELPGAVKDLDFDGLRSSLRESRATGLKRREVDRLPTVKGILAALDKDERFAATMSSLGPVVVVISRSSEYPSAIQNAIPPDWVYVDGQVASTGRKISFD